MQEINATQRSLNIEYAIRDVVVPATELEAQGHSIIKLNIGDPIAYPGLPTPPHMVQAFTNALNDGRNGYSPSYGLPELRKAIAKDESRKGWPASENDVYVCHGVTEALQILFQATLEKGDQVLAPGPHYPPYMAYPQMYGAETIEYRLNSRDAWKLDFEDWIPKRHFGGLGHGRIRVPAVLSSGSHAVVPLVFAGVVCGCRRHYCSAGGGQPLHKCARPRGIRVGEAQLIASV